MTKSTTRLILLPIMLSFLGCGGSGSGGNTLGVSSTQEVSVNFSISDAAPESISQVVITLDAIEFVRSGKSNVWVQEFYDPTNGDNSKDTVTFNLLDYQGVDSLDILKNVSLPAVDYESVVLHVLDAELSTSYILTTSGLQRPLKVPSQTLKLGSFTLKASDSSKTFVFEFDLPSSLVFNPGPQRYLLKPNGIRLLNAESSGTIFGQIDINYFNSRASCGQALTGNRLYVFLITDQTLLPNTPTTQTLHSDQAQILGESLSDHFDPKLDTSDQRIAPITSVYVDDSGFYEVGFLPPGSYVAAYTCVDTPDDPEVIDDISMTIFSDQLIYFYLNDTATVKEINLPVF